ncbi:GntR family transcriptional regulator [Leucobacter musarum]|uniref:GntR family transcriptional regulator n=1 Tax=Leucobacter musarum TaxID=1930747 RepID=UPI0006A76B44|nr:GntR family transcriptional regulator [Leucobacter musarum]
MPVPVPLTPTKKRRTLRGKAYDSLKAAILDGTFTPGERLDDAALQEWLGVSRTPIRESIALLTAAGLIETEAQRHTRVVLPDPDLAIEEIQAVGALSAGVIGLVVPVIDREARAHLQSRIGEVGRAAASEDADRTIPALQRLHEMLVELCPNATLRRIVGESVISLGFHLSITVTGQLIEWERLRDTAAALSDAIDMRDAVAAQRLIEQMHFIAVE